MTFTGMSPLCQYWIVPQSVWIGTLLGYSYARVLVFAEIFSSKLEYYSSAWILHEYCHARLSIQHCDTKLVLLLCITHAQLRLPSSMVFRVCFSYEMILLNFDVYSEPIYVTIIHPNMAFYGPLLTCLVWLRQLSYSFLGLAIPLQANRDDRMV